MKQQVHQLLKEGRFEFIGGMWSMPDNACPHYEDAITNMAIGHKFLLEEFGVRPRTAWLLDTFGNTVGHTRILKKAGYDSLFLGRENEYERNWRRTHKSMLYMNRPFYEQLGKEAEIMTVLATHHYMFTLDETFTHKSFAILNSTSNSNL